MKLYKISIYISVFCIGLLNVLAQGFTLPKYTKKTLKNGLTVYLMEQHEVPLTHISMVFKVGSVQDGKAFGLANLTSKALLYGTKTMSKSELEEKLDFYGASINSGSDKEFTRVVLSYASKDHATIYPIFKDVVLNPSFDKVEFENDKARLLQDLKEDRESPRSVIQDHYNTQMFANHPYSNPSGGTISSITSITQENVADFYKDYLTADNAAIVVVGDFSTDKMLKEIEATFGSWKTKAKKTITVSEPSMNFKEANVLLVDKDDAQESTFLFGAKGIDKKNPDYVAVSVINTILGGRFTSWLNDELRVNSGLTYGARSSFVSYKMGGSFYVSSFTAKATTIEAIDLAIEVVGRLHSKGIDKETLESAKSYIKGGFPPKYETSGQLAYLLSEMFVFGYDESFINTFQANVDKLDEAKAKEIIAKYFPKDNFQFTIIGKASEIREKVAKYGKVTEKKITADGF